MRISITEPLSSAWLRMNNLLFRPFDPGAWFGLGFTAFLAGLSEGAGGGGNSGTRIQDSLKGEGWSGGDWDGSLDSLRDSFTFLDLDTVAPALLMLLAVLAVVLAVAALYLASRGQFMFLDNLVRGRSDVVRPWRESGRLAASLFVWRIIYTIAVFVVMGGLALVGVLLFLPAILGDVGWGLMAPLAILAGTLGFILIVAAIYIEYFLIGFVVPIMYRHRVECSRAWGIFLALFRQHPGTFALSGIFYLLISVLGMLALLTAGLATCCIGLMLILLPYIGSVITLPYSVTLRYYTVDFLGQFGDDYRLLEPAGHRPTGGGLGQFDGDGTVVGPEDVGQDGGGDETRPQD